IARDEIIPLRDAIPQRAPVVAEGDPAIHAARPLVAQHLHREREIHLAVIADPLGDGPLMCSVACVLEEAGSRSHQLTSSSWARRARRYSSGITLTNRSRASDHMRSNRFATSLPVSAA